MKTIGKILIGVGCVAAVGALAGYGLKKLMEKAACCGCCDGECECEGDGYVGTCDCHCHDKAEDHTEKVVENVCVETPVAQTNDVAAETPAEA